MDFTKRRNDCGRRRTGPESVSIGLDFGPVVLRPSKTALLGPVLTLVLTSANIYESKNTRLAAESEWLTEKDFSLRL